jgi:hypothetical protein
MLPVMAFAGVFVAAERDTVAWVRSTDGTVSYGRGGLVERVRLIRPEVTDRDLYRLRGLVHLRVLSFGGGCGVRDLDTLPRLPYLWVFNAGGTAVSDLGVVALVSRCPALRQVDLQNTKATYATFEILTSLPDLQNL